MALIFWYLDMHILISWYAYFDMHMDITHKNVHICMIFVCMQIKHKFKHTYIHEYRGMFVCVYARSLVCLFVCMYGYHVQRSNSICGHEGYILPVIFQKWALQRLVDENSRVCSPVPATQARTCTHARTYAHMHTHVRIHIQTCAGIDRQITAPFCSLTFWSLCGCSGTGRVRQRRGVK